MKLDRKLSIHNELSLPNYIFVKNISKNTNNYEILIRRNVRYIFDNSLYNISRNNIHIIINKLLNFYHQIIYLDQFNLEKLIKCYFNKIKNINRYSFGKYDYYKKKIIRYRINLKLLKKYGSYERKKIEKELEYIKSLKLVSLKKSNEENLKLFIL